MARSRPEHARTGQKRRTREKIVDSAAATLRRTGADGAAIKQIMAEAGLTHGGFYAHFEDRDALVAAAFEAAMDQSRALWFTDLDPLAPEARLALLASRYMSRDHRDHPESGCPIPSLGAEIGRKGDAARDAALRSFATTLDRLTQDFDALAGQAGARDASADAAPDAPAPSPRDQATAFFALCIGAVTLARAAGSAPMSTEILAACRRAARTAIAGAASRNAASERASGENASGADADAKPETP